jgi:hypothetical protein
MIFFCAYVTNRNRIVKFLTKFLKIYLGKFMIKSLKLQNVKESDSHQYQDISNNFLMKGGEGGGGGGVES